MKLTKEQVEQLTAELNKVFGRAVLKCDGYTVIAVKEFVSATNLALVVYVDGVIKGEWMRGGEIATKFHYERKHHVYKQKARTDAAAMLRKRRLCPDMREFYERVLNATTSVWVPYWGSVPAFVRHIGRVCASIEVQELGYPQP